MKIKHINRSFNKIIHLIPKIKMDNSCYDYDDDYDGVIIPTCIKKHTKIKKQTGRPNLTCHVCRISINRTRVVPIGYSNCIECFKSFCDRCNDNHISPYNIDCLVCRGECCCSTEYCNKEHEHCYTYKRTKRRHKNTPNIKPYKKKDIPIKIVLIDENFESIKHNKSLIDEYNTITFMSSLIA